MRLCDDCIQKIRDSLNSEVEEILQKRIFPLLKKRENVSGRELAQAIDLDRTGVKQVIEELKNHLLLEYSYRGRKRIYSLTETAERYREVEENPELISTSAVETEEQEAELKQEKDNQSEAEVELQESQKKNKTGTEAKNEIDRESENEVDTEAEKKQEEEQQEKDEETTADISKPEEDNKQGTTIEKKQEPEESDQQDEDLVWNMKL